MNEQKDKQEKTNGGASAGMDFQASLYPKRENVGLVSQALFWFWLFSLLVESQNMPLPKSSISAVFLFFSKKKS
jgi:hypothetical protein